MNFHWIPDQSSIIFKYNRKVLAGKDHGTWKVNISWATIFWALEFKFSEFKHQLKLFLLFFYSLIIVQHSFLLLALAVLLNVQSSPWLRLHQCINFVDYLEMFNSSLPCWENCLRPCSCFWWLMNQLLSPTLLYLNTQLLPWVVAHVKLWRGVSLNSSEILWKENNLEEW